MLRCILWTIAHTSSYLAIQTSHPSQASSGIQLHTVQFLVAVHCCGDAPLKCQGSDFAGALDHPKRGHAHGSANNAFRSELMHKSIVKKWDTYHEHSLKTEWHLRDSGVHMHACSQRRQVNMYMASSLCLCMFVLLLLLATVHCCGASAALGRSARRAEAAVNVTVVRPWERLGQAPVMWDTQHQASPPRHSLLAATLLVHIGLGGWSPLS